MLYEAEIIIGGFSFEKVKGVRTLKSVFVLSIDNKTSIEVPVLDDESIDKGKLAKELIEYYRKKVKAIIDIKNAGIMKNRNFVDLGFVGVNKEF